MSSQRKIIQFNFEEYTECPKDWDLVKIAGCPMMDNFQNSREMGVYFKKINQDIIWVIIRRYDKVFAKFIIVKKQNSLFLWKAPIIRFYDPECIKVFIDYLLQKKKNIEIVFSVLMPQEELYLLNKGFTKEDSYWTVFLDTLRKDSTFSGMASDKIRNYKKCLNYKCGLNLCMNLSSGQKKTFIQNLKKYSGNDENLILDFKISALIETPNTRVVAVYFNETQIAGALLLHTPNICEIRYSYTDYNFRNLTPLTYLYITLYNNTKGGLIDLSGLTGDNNPEKLNINLYKTFFGGFIYEFKRFKFIKK